MANTGRPKGKLDSTKRKSRKDADQERVIPLKEMYLVFYRRFPIQAAAADFIGRSVDTIQVWQNEDPEFLAEVKKAKAEYAAKKFHAMKPDNLLMHLYPDLRPPKQEVEQTGETSVTITYVHPTDTNQAVPEAAPGVADHPEPDHD